MTEEEGKKKYSDMRAVDVGIRHNYYLTVTELFNIKVVADTASERLDNRNYRGVGVYLIKTRFFNVKHLTAKRKDSLESRVTAVLCRAACRISLYEIYLGKSRISLVTVCKLTGKS